MYEYIRRIPFLSTENKMRLNKTYLDIGRRIKYSKRDYERVKGNNTLIVSNYNYGHEYWLKKHCGYSDYIYGVIEHGVYFGDFRGKDGYEEEYDFGSILTYGDYRINILKEVFPGYNIVGVGPRIHYAETDMQYYNELKSMIDPNYRTIALYPDHGATGADVECDVKSFVSRAMDIANDINAKNIFLSLHPYDLALGLDKEFKTEGKNLILVTGGRDQLKFLPRLRAIFSLSDLIYSNAIGTYIGYSVYFNKPNIIELGSNHKKYWNAYIKEQSEFARIFNGDHPMTVTREQRELCDYYFGYNHIKTPVTLYKELEKCKCIFKKRYK